VAARLAQSRHLSESPVIAADGRSGVLRLQCEQWRAAGIHPFELIRQLGVWTQSGCGGQQPRCDGSRPCSGRHPWRGRLADRFGVRVGAGAPMGGSLEEDGKRQRSGGGECDADSRASVSSMIGPHSDSVTFGE
jgi:hypothetical protein